METDRIPIMSQEWLLLDETFIRKFTTAEYSVYSNIWLLSQARNIKAIPIEIPLEFRVKGVSQKSAKAALEHLLESKVLYKEGNLIGINSRTREWQIPDSTPTKRREYWTLMGLMIPDTTAEQ